MLKIVVFDNGLGGELFAEKLEFELPIVEIIRVIGDPNLAIARKDARHSAETALLPYIGKVDLIIFANYLLSATSLSYFRRKYKNQKFIGFQFQSRRIAPQKSTLIITTKATTKNLAYFAFSHRIKAKTVCVDTPKILPTTLTNFSNFSPEQILLLCGDFSRFTPELRKTFGHNVRIVDSFEDTIREACRVLHIRGGTGKKCR
jgi:glutamate racemase